MESTAGARKEAIRALWHRGVLEWKLHDAQKKMLKAYIAHNDPITVFACSRRFGKTYLLCVLAIETCLKKPNAIVKFVCPKKNQVKTNIQPLMTDIFRDCPNELKPEFKTNEYVYQFPNGSQIHLAGTDNGHHENLRGSRSDLWIVDEAGFCDELKYVVNTILAPTTDTTGGRGIIASTPSKEGDHEFIMDFYRPYDEENKLIKYTIYDNPLLSKAKIQEIIQRYARKEKDPEFRREYLVEIVNASDLSVVPEFTEEVEAKIVKVVPKPPYYDAYVAMDIGGKDMTAIIFGYYDFRNARLVIEDEIVFNKQTDNAIESSRNDLIAKAIKDKEESLWRLKPPYLRIADNNNVILLNDLNYQYGLTFFPTRKDQREAAINNMRVWISSERVIIHPKCTTLIAHLKHAMWAPNRKDFARSKVHAHYDALPALMYLIRNIVESKNPYPKHMLPSDFHQPHVENKHTPVENAWLDIFKRRTSLKR
jgi:hypothetical protein